MTSIRQHGDERELTLMARSGDGSVIDPAKLIDPVMNHIRRIAPTVPLDDRSGVFLTHGRVYRESGGLLELAAADTQSPLGAVRQSVLLRHVVADALRALEKDLGLEDFIVSQHNTAYTTHNPSHSTAGHFNITRYLPVSAYLPSLAALGAALPYVSGGGGYDMETLQFTLSVRGLRCTQLLSNKTQSERGIIDTKPMPASRGQRQQLLGVDNLQSHVQTRIVYTILNLFYTCMENELGSHPRIELSEPVADMHRMILGPTIDHTFGTVDGDQLSAAEILRTFLEWYASHLKSDWMPAWADHEISIAMKFVDDLDNEGLDGLVGTADHATLHHLWQVTLDEYGLNPEQAEKARTALVQMSNAYQGPSILQDAATSFVNCADALAGEVGHASTICTEYLMAARSFMQLAYRYGDVRHEGMYAQLVESGMTDKGVLFDTTHVETHANSAAPKCEGRTAARGEVIIKLHADGIARASSAGWDSIQTPSLGLLSLTDYANTDTDHWQKPKPTPPDPRTPATLSDVGFGALHAYMQAQVEGIHEDDQNRQLLIVDDDDECPF